MRINRVSFLDLDFDNLAFDEVKARLAEVTPESPYGYVVTPNVDHIIKLARQPWLRPVYDDALLCVCDSRILALLARFQGRRLEVVAGSDLTEALFRDVIRAGDRIAIVGGDQELIRQLQSRFPAFSFTHHAAPPGLAGNEAARRRAAAFVASANARFTILAVGAPQQELIAREVLSLAPSGGVALCVGASLDFLTGRQKRAPRLLRKLGLEWAHRLITNPRRLWRRYLVDGLAIFPIYARQARATVLGCAIVALLVIGLAAGAIYGLLARDRDPGQISSRSDANGPSPALVPQLPPPDLLRPLSPDEAERANAERPFVRRPDEPASSFRLSAAPEHRQRAETCLAQAIYYEAAGEGIDGGRAVAQVVLNRVRHPAYPASVCGVVYQGSERATGCQFSFTCDGSLGRAPGPSAWATARRLAEEALAGRVFGPVGHATHYHANYVLPYWADSLDKAVQVGRHIFYRLRGSVGDRRIFTQRYAGAEPLLPADRGAPLVIAPPIAEQLVERLLADDLSSRSSLAMAPLNPDIPPNAPLGADEAGGTLIIDAEGSRRAIARPKARPDCDEEGDERKLRPLEPNSLTLGSKTSC